MTDRIYLGGVTNTTLHIESDGTTHVEEKTDCQTLLDGNQRKRDHRFHAGDGFMREVAEVDMVAYLAKCRAIGQTPFASPDIAMELILADPQFEKFLTAPKTRDAHVIIKGMR